MLWHQGNRLLRGFRGLWRRRRFGGRDNDRLRFETNQKRFIHGFEHVAITLGPAILRVGNEVIYSRLDRDRRDYGSRHGKPFLGKRTWRHGHNGSIRRRRRGGTLRTRLQRRSV